MSKPTKSATVLRFDRTADGYKRWWAPVLAPSCGVLIDRLTTLDPRTTTEAIDVLDAGCGTGNLTFEAVRRWPNARIAGADLSDGMLAVAERERAGLAADAASRIEFVASDAAEIPFADASFDVVVSAYVVQQVLDRPAVLREIRRLLRPSGVLGLLGWLEAPNAFGAAAIDGALEDAGVVRPRIDEVRAGNYASIEQAVDELRAAGFDGIETQRGNLDQPWTMEDFVAYHTQVHDIEMMDAMSPGQRQAFVAALRTRLQALPAETMIDRAAILLLTARAG
jgi:ubiquinone/menaquinone biosynthesis C-methylase UbiE